MAIIGFIAFFFICIFIPIKFLLIGVFGLFRGKIIISNKEIIGLGATILSLFLIITGSIGTYILTTIYVGFIELRYVFIDNLNLPIYFPFGLLWFLGIILCLISTKEEIFPKISS